MNKSLASKLYYKYVGLLSIIFILFLITVMWSLHSHYYEHVDNSLKKIATKLENKISNSYYLGKKDINFNEVDSLFNIQVYESIEDKFHPVWRVNHANFIPHNKNFVVGMNIKLLDVNNSTAYHAIYHKAFDVYRHKYYMYIIIDVSHHHEKAKNLFIWLLLLGSSLYLLALYLGYKTIKEVTRSIPDMLKKLTHISGDSLQVRMVLPEKKDELFLLSKSINEMLDRIEKSLMQTKRFNAKVSHELRTPLTIIRGEIEVGLFKDRPIEEYKALLMSTLEEVDTLQSITDNMLLLTKLDFEIVQVKKLNVHFDKLIESVISSCQIQAKTKCIKIIADLENITYSMEETLMKLSIKNLIINAIKYSPNNTVIDIVLKQEDETVVLEVHDQGYGISDKECKLLFEPFYRAKNIELTDILGEGLGLSIVAHTMSIHDADLTVSSKVGAGSSFKIVFKY